MFLSDGYLFTVCAYSTVACVSWINTSHTLWMKQLTWSSKGTSYNKSSASLSRCSYSLMLRAYWRNNKYQLWFEPTSVRTNDLPYLMQARKPLRNWCGLQSVKYVS